MDVFTIVSLISDLFPVEATCPNNQSCDKYSTMAKMKESSMEGKLARGLDLLKNL